MRRGLWFALGGLAFVVVSLLTVFPTRTYLGQRSDLNSARERLEILEQQNAQLEKRIDVLHTDEEIERLAREQYNLVRPGEEAYAILPSREPADAAEAKPKKEENDDRGFWSTVWDGITFWS